MCDLRRSLLAFSCLPPPAPAVGVQYNACCVDGSKPARLSFLSFIIGKLRAIVCSHPCMYHKVSTLDQQPSHRRVKRLFFDDSVGRLSWFLPAFSHLLHRMCAFALFFLLVLRCCPPSRRTILLCTCAFLFFSRLCSRPRSRFRFPPGLFLVSRSFLDGYLDFDSMVFPQAMSLDALVASHPIEVKVRGK